MIYCFFLACQAQYNDYGGYKDEAHKLPDFMSFTLYIEGLKTPQEQLSY